MSDTDTPTPEALKPCPFCGGRGALTQYVNESQRVDTHYVACDRIRTEGCGAVVPPAVNREANWTKAEAIAAWNRRTQEGK